MRKYLPRIIIRFQERHDLGKKKKKKATGMLLSVHILNVRVCVILINHLPQVFLDK